MFEPAGLLGREVGVERPVLQRLPVQPGDARVECLTVVVGHHPCRERTIERRACPLPGVVINPEGTVAGMSCAENGCIAERTDGVHQGFSLGGNLQLIGYGTGFWRAWWNRCIYQKGEFEAFKKNFYK